MPRLAGYTPRINSILGPLVVITGLYGIYFVVIYHAPTIPIEAGMYNPGSAFNNISVHYKAHSHIGHIAHVTKRLYILRIKAKH